MHETPEELWSSHASPPDPVDQWARLESKSATTEADLSRRKDPAQRTAKPLADLLRRLADRIDPVAD